MLPRELIAQISSHLDLLDLLSFTQTCKAWRNIPDDAFSLPLLEKVPYFRIQYSQWDGWKKAALNCLKNTPELYKFNGYLNVDIRVNQPLPNDFYCLCKQPYYINGWSHNDKGVDFRSTLINLTETPADLAPNQDRFVRKGRRTFILAQNGIQLGIPTGDLAQVKQSSKMLAAIALDGNRAYVSLKWKREDNKNKACDQKVQLPGTGRSSNLHVFDNVAVVFSERVDMIFLEGQEPLKIKRLREMPPEGVLVYDGTIYDVTMKPRYIL